MHDVNDLSVVVFEFNGRILSEEELKNLYVKLPYFIKNEINIWGIDAIVRDSIYDYLRKNKEILEGI